MSRPLPDLRERFAQWRASSRRLLAIQILVDAVQPLAALVVLDVIATAVAPVLVLVALGVTVGRLPAAAAAGMDSAAGQDLTTSFVAVVVIFALSMLLVPLHRVVAAAVRVRLNYRMQSRLMSAVSTPSGISHLERSSVRDSVELAQGSLMSFFPADAPVALAGVLGSRLTGVLGCLVLASFRWWLGLALLIMWPLARRPLMRVVTDHVAAFGGDADVMRRAAYYWELATTAPAAKELRVFGLGPWSVDRFNTHWFEGMAEVWRIRATVYATTARVGAAILVVHLAAVAAIAWGAHQGELTLAQVSYMLPLLPVIMVAGSLSFEDISLEWMLAALPHLRSLEGLLDEQPALPEGGSVVRGIPEHEIRFDGVGFRYPGADHDVFDGLDLVLPSGRSTAVVGANGAGKTTLVKLLARLQDPTSGTILADGRPLAELDPAQWQRRVAVVFQDFVKFPVDAHDNIAFGAIEHRSDADGVRRAAARSGAGPVIDALEQGWDTTLSRDFAGGADLSGGEWQRVALSRALFAVQHGASILVLDEPTAWLDVRGEAEFFERFLEITEGLTTLIISHRFSTVRLADNICVVDGGRVAEHGSHDELLALDGEYARMFRLQAARFTDEPVSADAPVAAVRP